MPFFDNIEQLRSVEWGHTYLWDCRFSDPSPPAPFSSWVPATSMDEDLAMLESYSFDARGGGFSVPLRRGGIKKVTLNFTDDVNNTLLNWFEVWINEVILDRDGTVVAPLESCVRKLQVLRLNHAKEIVGNMREYWVYPEGRIGYSGDSASNVRAFPVTLVIVATVGNTPLE